MYNTNLSFSEELCADVCQMDGLALCWGKGAQLCQDGKLPRGMWSIIVDIVPDYYMSIEYHRRLGVHSFERPGANYVGYLRYWNLVIMIIIFFYFFLIIIIIIIRYFFFFRPNTTFVVDWALETFVLFF